MKDDFIWIAGDALSTMRLCTEGAISLFENDAVSLTKLAHDHQEWMAAEALDAIGEALYNLRECIRQLQEARITSVQETETSVK